MKLKGVKRLRFDEFHPLTFLIFMTNIVFGLFGYEVTEMLQKKRMRKENDLGKDPIPQLVLRLAIPAMLAQFVNVLYSVIDRMYIGNIPEIGETALAGVGICGPIVTMLSAFAAWIGNGGAPLLAIKCGEQNKKGASAILANSFLLLLGMGTLLTLLGFLTKDFLIVKFGATEAIFPYAEAYMSVYLAGTVFSVLALGLNQFIICQGFAGLGMTSVVIGAVFNIVLDPVFIFGLHMDVAGAALATVLSQAASCLFTLWILFRGPVPVRITFHGYAAGICARILTLGVTPFLIILFDNVLIIIQNVMLKMYGGADSDMLLTCNTIVQSFMLIITMPLGGITAGTQSILGYNYGAANTARIRLAEKHIIKTALIFCTIMFALAQWEVTAGLFVGLFTQNTAYQSLTVQFIRIYTLGVIPLALQYALVDGLTGMSLVAFSCPLSFVRKGLYIGLVVFLSVTFGAAAMFWAEPVSDVVAAAISCITFLCVIPGALRRREAAVRRLTSGSPAPYSRNVP